MQNLFNYSVGGTIHIVVNNQIGFTTDPSKSRSSLYCTDVGKAIGAPILHVNGDSIEDVAKACIIAAEYRQKFREDIIIDIIGYRRFGHNELD
jgi:2-oxoglutarate dehydrogenase E1 component